MSDTIDSKRLRRDLISDMLHDAAQRSSYCPPLVRAKCKSKGIAYLCNLAVDGDLFIECREHRSDRSLITKRWQIQLNRTYPGGRCMKNLCSTSAGYQLLIDCR